MCYELKNEGLELTIKKRERDIAIFIIQDGWGWGGVEGEQYKR